MRQPKEALLKLERILNSADGRARILHRLREQDPTIKELAIDRRPVQELPDASIMKSIKLSVTVRTGEGERVLVAKYFDPDKRTGKDF